TRSNARAAPRVPHAPVGLSAERGRSTFMGHPEALRPSEGCPRGEPRRRERRRAARSLSAPPQAALGEPHAAEYGGGRPERVHATLFADTMRAFGLDAEYGTYID